MVSVTKGIELATGFRMSEVILDVIDHDPSRVCALSGPNLAREVMAGQPSATVLACPPDAPTEWLRHVMTTESFRVFTNHDLIGCEVGGAVKNVIAIAAGIGDGLGYGWNTKAALITRGLAEITRLGVALTASPITFLGLAGNGDLTATCASPQSRNRHVGEELGKGRPLDEITAEMLMVAEGVTSTPAIAELAHRLGVRMPITRKVDAVLQGRLSPLEAVRQLMELEPGPELEELG
jgi:glycerol-3-phosphate dehydrogenase (NAD(P)+)